MSLAHWAMLLLAQNPKPAAQVVSAAELPAILRQLGDAEYKQRAEPHPCAYRENLRVEEQDDKGTAIGWEECVSEAEHRDDIRYTMIESRRGGSPLDSRLKPRRDEELSAEEKRKRRELRTPFHRDEQPRYRFEWRGLQPDGRVVIGFEPREPSPERFKGSAVIDPNAMRLVAMDQQLSQYPAFLWTLDVQVSFETTVCGEQMTRLTTRGSGGFLFIRKFFRSAVERVDFRSLAVESAR